MEHECEIENCSIHEKKKIIRVETNKATCGCPKSLPLLVVNLWESMVDTSKQDTCFGVRDKCYPTSCFFPVYWESAKPSKSLYGQHEAMFYLYQVQELRGYRSIPVVVYWYMYASNLYVCNGRFQSSHTTSDILRGMK